MNGIYYGHMFGWDLAGSLMMIVPLVVIFLLVAWLIKLMRDDSRGETRQMKSALDILKERYAKGEINKNEFDDKKKDLIH